MSVGAAAYATEATASFKKGRRECMRSPDEVLVILLKILNNRIGIPKGLTMFVASPTICHRSFP